MIDQLIRRADTIRAELEKHNRLYYEEAAPQISDREYDRLMEELIELEKAHPELVTPTSPTHRVGGNPIAGFKTVDHALPMMSIDNTYDADTVRDFDRRVREILEGMTPEYVLEPKIDGVAVSLRYEAGELVLAATRGDGRRGDDVTENVKTIRSVPLKLEMQAAADSVIEVRGEILMPNAAFTRINEGLVARGEEPLKNPRNAAAGTLKQLDPKVTASRGLAFLAHGLGEVRPSPPDDYWAWLQRLRQWGLPIPPNAQLATTVDEVLLAIEKFAATRSTLPFLTDGMVIKVRSLRQREKLGYTSKSPRWVIAYKYPAEQVPTTLNGITWQVGKAGTLTPVAELAAVDVAGSTVRRATLHNIEQIQRLDARIGDTVLIEKAGEVIPYVVRVITESRPAGAMEIQPPAACPSCQQPVVTEAPFVRCTNPECPAQLKERIRWFCARGQMNVERLGESLVDQLVDAGLVKTFADIFRLKYEDLVRLPRMAAKSASNVLESIDASRGRPLERLLAGLGIRHVGNTTARDLANHFGTLERLENASIDDLDEVEGIDVVVASAIHDFFRSAAGQHAINELRKVGIDPETKISATPADLPLAGQNVVVTGALRNFDRPAIEELIVSLGGKPVGSVSKKTSFVLAGEDAGSKLEKAKTLGIPILNEDEFLSKIGRKNEMPPHTS